MGHGALELYVLYRIEQKGHEAFMQTQLVKRGKGCFDEETPTDISNVELLQNIS